MFSENGDYVLIKYIDTSEPIKCTFDYLFLKNKKEGNSLIQSKDSIYFEAYGDKKKTKDIDSIFCINNSVQYKNRDTSYHASYIFYKMSLKNFYKEYALNQKGILINNEISYKIENIRDTIFNHSTDPGIEKPYPIDAKIFDLIFIHKGKVLKKLI